MKPRNLEERGAAGSAEAQPSRLQGLSTNGLPSGSLLDPSSRGKGQECLQANRPPSFQPLALLGSYCSKAVSVSGYVEQLWPQGIESFSKRLK